MDIYIIHKVFDNTSSTDQKWNVQCNYSCILVFDVYSKQSIISFKTNKNISGIFLPICFTYNFILVDSNKEEK